MLDFKRLINLLIAKLDDLGLGRIGDAVVFKVAGLPLITVVTVLDVLGLSRR